MELDRALQLVSWKIPRMPIMRGACAELHPSRDLSVSINTAIMALIDD
jgi:hypothetical protein